MAKIPLRAYLKEIENFIERGEIEQAIAHAKNILQAYPKHIETYRLLGKAFLESQRFAEAADILQRVLSVIPDDFVSQIGISIIREDEGNLDAAIWHMERAYEVQPFNPAVQDELRRLYGRRDGVEPPKIRLTRGALVRMYMRGELYPQAIGETRAALAEDPQRLDLRVLLARLYHLTGQKNDAAEVCSDLITKLPYCYEANRLLAEILPTTNRADETPKFQQRIYALDPYEAFISPSAPTAAQVPDQAVMIEQFLWEPGMEGAQAPEWTKTAGVEWQEQETEPLPEWLSTLKPQTEAPEVEETAGEAQATEAIAPEAAPTADEDLVPGWMKEAGWAASERSANEIMAEEASRSQAGLTGTEFPAEEDFSTDSVLPAEIPEWLQSKAPETGEPTPAEEAERTDWLDSLFTQQGETGPGAPASEIPAAEVAGTMPSEEIPGWLSEIKPDEPTAESEGIAPLPDWFTSGQEEAPLTAERAEYLPSEELTAFPEETAVVEPPVAEPSAAAEEIPDWLKELETGAPEEKITADEEKAWDLDLPAVESEATATPAELPDWLKTEEVTPELPTAEVVEAPALAEVEPPIHVEPAAPVASESNALPAAEEMPPLNDMDAAMAWLESLAARQGADEATLTTAPEQRTETPPDWVKKEMVGEESGGPEAKEPLPFAEETLPMTEEAATAEAVESQLPSASAEIPTAAVVEQPEPQAEEAAAPTAPTAEIPQPAAEPSPTPEPAAASEPSFSDMDATMAWLESLAARQGADEATLVTRADQRTETPPDWVQKEMAAQASAPELAPETPEPALQETAPVEPAAEGEIPDWLKEAIEPQTAQPAGEIAMEGSTEPESPAAEAEVPTPAQAERFETPIPTSSLPEVTAQEEVPAAPEEPQAAAETPTAALEAVPEPSTETPDWLTGIGEERRSIEAENVSPWEAAPAEPTEKAEELPDWLQTEPTTIHPEEEGLASKGEAIPDWLKGLEETGAEELAPEGAALPTSVDYRAAWEPEHTEEPTPEAVAQSAEQAEPEAVNLTDLRAALDRGSVEKALDGYNRYIQDEKNLPDVIHDLKDALYRYPVDISIWQTLGDAYARNNQLQDALDAYTKAEELLR